ncbi:MAG: universal stress protein [Myxococcota bacterium]
MHPPKHIVVATDFSDTAELALDRAIELARHFDAELHVTHVFALPVPAVGVYDFAIPESGIREARESALRRLEGAAQKAVAAGVRTHTHLVATPTETGISDVAREVGAEMIVVGTHGHTGLKHVLLGSVAERVVRHAPCSVLVVRPDSSAA